MHFPWIPRWALSSNYLDQERPETTIIISRPASSKLVPTPTISPKWRSNKPIKFKGKLTDQNWLVTRVRWLMFQVCEDGQLSGAGLQCGYHSAGRVRLYIGLRGAGKLQVRETAESKDWPHLPRPLAVWPGSRWSSRDTCLTTLSPIIYRQVNIISISRYQSRYLITQVLSTRPWQDFQNRIGNGIFQTAESYIHSFFVLIKTKSPGVVQNKKILIKIWKFHV